MLPTLSPLYKIFQNRYVINDVEYQLRQPESLCVNIEADTRSIQRLKETLDKLEEQ